MGSVFSVIRRAVKPGADDDSLIGDEPGADASNVEPAGEASATKEDLQMSEDKKTPGANDKPAGADTAAVAADAATAAKARIKAITGHSEAEGREGLASHLAFETDMSAEDAGKVMASAPKAEKAKAEGDYEQRRLAAASGLAQPSADNGQKAARKDDLNPSAIFENRRKSMKGA